MPWCEECSRFVPPEDLTGDGSCPECETVIGEPPRTPWHFKLLVVAVVVYLGWRAVQGIAWLVEHV